MHEVSLSIYLEQSWSLASGTRGAQRSKHSHQFYTRLRPYLNLGLYVPLDSTLRRVNGLMYRMFDDFHRHLIHNPSL